MSSFNVVSGPSMVSRNGNIGLTFLVTVSPGANLGDVIGEVKAYAFNKYGGSWTSGMLIPVSTRRPASSDAVYRFSIYTTETPAIALRIAVDRARRTTG